MVKQDLEEIQVGFYIIRTLHVVAVLGMLLMGGLSYFLTSFWLDTSFLPGLVGRYMFWLLVFFSVVAVGGVLYLRSVHLHPDRLVGTAQNPSEVMDNYQIVILIQDGYLLTIGFCGVLSALLEASLVWYFPFGGVGLLLLVWYWPRSTDVRQHISV